MEITLAEGMPVIALGALAFVNKLMPNGKVEIQLKKDRSRHVLTIDEIELINLSEKDSVPKPRLSEAMYRFHDTSIESAEIAQKRYVVLNKCVNNEITVSQAAEELDLSVSTIYKLRRSFAKEDGVMALLANKKGRKLGLSALQAPVEAVMDAAISKNYRGKGATVKKIHLSIIEECRRLELSPPSLSTVQRRVRKLSPLEKMTAIHGADYAKEKLGLKTGKLVLSRPLEQVQIDHTEVDILLAGTEDGERAVRPWLTVVIDSYTRVILGFYLALHPPSAVSVAAALSMACFTKASFLNAIGASSATYPFYGKPELIFVDNAVEFRSSKFVRACSLNNIRVEWRPIGKKHWGGIVERVIGTLMRKVHSLPGTTMSSVSQRPQGEINATVTFPRLLVWLTLQIEIYHNTSHRGLQGRSPANVWFEAFQTDNGSPIYPPLIADPFKFKLDFMPEDRRSITSRGIQFKRNFYSSQALALHVGRKDVIIKYDPFKMKKIWAYIDNNYIEADYGMTRPDMSLAEVMLASKPTKQPPWLTSEQGYAVRFEAEKLIRKRNVSKAKKENYELANSYIPGPSSEAELSDASELDGRKFIPTIYPVKE
ncbi:MULTISPECIES: Mu transposase C-terminal domain-containing protein [Stutzerimonas]|jgi:putative transposase|uniref:Putative transposase n=1 Tax=Stutzerimonas stutzeri TaxID=316 RepID=A0A5S5BGS7_STUST|nr:MULTISPECIES: Mu transposase C-terminal domain-containing protein [Stutzerimonas]AZZ45368.1 hypothetical protein C1896_10910 [Pseudomonadaceae bacterium SI-3]MBK57685.1 hypothetical protein [Pseudomonas sp.]MBU0811394.1 DDE-type integrase/transposase/recombinase [Gammaproteobacteria bacterium]MBK3845435.1 DDE-type integrase/transposase/recombinase [Stutzerimonas xanthomarina]MBK3846128.1 DDE-type integrase/transposase/recombinase [Stutzerimonas xanthomarina]|tara:strand:- start:9201 stop:10994 length:1794 start_codon:yes stop_codon:yes gene_type:complete